MNNKRWNIIRECAGLRIVSMYVQEYFFWGWQVTNQQNDDGIDGEITVRDRLGKDEGGKIQVQIKSGPWYCTTRKEYKKTDKFVNIKPYASAKLLASHMEDFKKSISPVILVWVNTNKKRNNDPKYEDLLHPEVWWERVDNYNYTGGTVITLSHKLGEHTKGEWYSMVRPLMSTWSVYPHYYATRIEKNLFYSSNLFNDARSFYKAWNDRENRVKLDGREELIVKKTRTGWRHINKQRRGIERINYSLRLLAIAEMIMTQGTPALYLGEKRTPGNVWLRYGLRALVKINGDDYKVQVVLLAKKELMAEKKECQFFSVHVIK